MSVDVTICLKNKPLPNSFQPVEGDGWLVSVDGPFRIQKSDIDPPLLNYLSGKKWTIELHLEGKMSNDGTTALKRLLEKAVHELDGVAFHHEDDTITSTSGTSAVIRLPVSAPSTTYALAMFFENADQITKESVSLILDTIETIFPEALPHRYGDYEPLQEKWSNGGKARFLEIWDRRETLFCMGKTPVSDVTLTFDYNLGRDLGEFRCGKLEFCFRNSIQRLPTKLDAAFRVFEELLPVLNPFYAGFLEEEHVPGPRWKGMPGYPHSYLVLGKPMLTLWPEFLSVSDPLKSGHRIFKASSGLKNLLPPEALQEPMEKNRYYDGGYNGERSMRPSGKYAVSFPFKKADPYWQAK